MLQRLSRLAPAIVAVGFAVAVPANAGAQGSVLMPDGSYCTARACVRTVTSGGLLFYPGAGGVGGHFGLDMFLGGSLRAFADIAALAPSHARVSFAFYLPSGGGGATLFTTLPATPFVVPLTPELGGLVGSFGDQLHDVPLPFGAYFELPAEVRLTFTDAATGGNVLATETVLARFANAPEPATMALTAGGLLVLAGVARRRRG